MPAALPGIPAGADHRLEADCRCDAFCPCASTTPAGIIARRQTGG